MSGSVSSAGHVPYVPKPITTQPDSSAASVKAEGAEGAAQSAAEPDFDRQVDSIVSAAQALAEGVEGSSYSGDEGLEQRCFALVTSLHEKAGPIQLRSYGRLTEDFGKIIDDRETPKQTREELRVLMRDLIHVHVDNISFEPGPGPADYPKQLKQLRQQLDAREFIAARDALTAADPPKDATVRFELAQYRMQQHATGKTTAAELLKAI